MFYKIFIMSLLFFQLEAFGAEDSFYNFSWLDPDKEVFVLQNRKYRKKGKFHINVGGGMTTSGAFVDSTTLQGRIGYFFKEEWGFEGLYASNSGEENDTARSLRSDGTAGSTPFRRIVDEYAGAMILWSPFYTKVNTFNKIIYLDLILGLGYATLTETNNRDEFLLGLDSAQKTEEHNGILWELGVNFFVNSSWHVRLDLTTIHYQAQRPSSTAAEDEYYSNFDLSLSVGMAF
jgi:outer membrane beta-barrel protein